MKSTPAINQLVALLGGPALFPHLTEAQVHEFVEEHVADLLAQIHARARSQALKSFLSEDERAREAAAAEIASQITAQPRAHSGADLPFTVDAEGVAFHLGAARGLTPKTEDQVRKANDLWYRIPPPRGPLDFLTMIRSKKTSNRKASRG